MQYQQGPQGQPQYGTPQQMQAMYSGMAQYGQPPAQGPKGSSNKEAEGNPGLGEDATSMTMRSFEQMTLGGPQSAPQPQMGHMSYANAGQPGYPAQDYSRAAYGMASQAGATRERTER